MKNLKALMTKKNITQINLSVQIGVTQETISAYLNNKAKPSADTLIKIADYLNTTTDYLLERTDIDYSINNAFSSPLPQHELQLLDKYRNLSTIDKAKINSYIDGLNDK